MQKALQKIIYDSKCLHSSPMGIMVTEFFEKRLKALGDGWIPVSEALPQKPCSLIVTDGEEVGEGYFDGSDFLWGDDCHYRCNATHYQALPLLPNK